MSPNAIGYHMSQRLHELLPDKAILQTTDSDFNIEAFAHEGLCKLTIRNFPHSEVAVFWNQNERRIMDDARNAWYEVTWRGYSFDVIMMCWNDNVCCWIMADIKEMAETFFMTVCEWESEVRDEVLVFDGGHWRKDEELFKAIKGATFDNLILSGTLKHDLRADLEQFLASRATYATYGIPWKRGLLLVGPPGNGKTHAVKALINALGVPCLYVKSFSNHGPDEVSIQRVFARARQTTPCILVLEDLDSLVTARNRSFFLNELDGFAQNVGIITLATTNYPEKLDPALVNRPSRFDRKYHFDLPAQTERAAYIGLWNVTLQADLRMTDAEVAAVAAQTAGFSFAYLKELFVSAMMGWVAAPRPGNMAGVMAAQVALLRDQMTTTNTPTTAKEDKAAPRVSMPSGFEDDD